MKQLNLLGEEQGTPLFSQATTNTNALTWTETTAEDYYYMLGEMPPIYGTNGGWAVSEPVRHNRQGQPVYRIYREMDGKYYESLGTVEQMNAV